MNFLSHFYFDRHSKDHHLVLGTILPDLVKNARKDWNLHPIKRLKLYNSEAEFSILRGWERHLSVDRHFHNSDFFHTHTQAIKKLIRPALENSVVRPSFLAHISLELMLDSTLLRKNHLDAENLYEHLRRSNKSIIQSFLEKNDIYEPSHFFSFFEKFIESQYLHQYRESDQIIYALKRICMRIWRDPLEEKQINELSEILNGYHDILNEKYLEIYHEISLALEPI